MVARVVIGNHPTAGLGLYVSQPGYDALSEDPNDRAKFSFSTTWGGQLGIVYAGVVLAGTWTPIPGYLNFWPVIAWEQKSDTYVTAYFAPTAEIGGSGATATVLLKNRLTLQYRNNPGSGAREFQIKNEAAGGGSVYARVIITTAKIQT
jgi:hypothetical protein